jgi:hypothetical protein
MTRVPPFGTEHPEYDAIMWLHNAAVAEGLACYRDPRTGLSVMTADFLARRGYCCESGCRHCPYRQQHLH